MIWHIARKEMIEMFRDGRFRASAAILSVLLFTALVLGWRQQARTSAQHEAARQATRAQWLGQGKKNPHSAAHYGVYAFKPKSPLALADPGTDAYTGVAVWLEAHKQNEFKYRPAQDATAVQRFGEMTGAAVLQLLVPLLIVLLTFNAFSGERESGTLRQLFSLGVQPASLALGKAAGVGVPLLLLLTPAAIIASLAIATAEGAGGLAAALPRATAMAAGYLLYFAAWIAGSLAVSAIATSSRVALIALLGFWMFDGLVAPRAAADIARAVKPAPSAFEFAADLEAALKNGIGGHEPTEERNKRMERELLKKYNVDRLEALPVNLTGVRLQAGEDHGNEVFDHAYSGLWKTFEEQDRVRRWAAFAAPGLAIRSISMGFAGSDFAQHAHFAKAAEEYRRGIQRVMNDDIMKNAGAGAPYFAGNDLWAKVGPFEYTAPDAQWVMGRQAGSFGVLLAWCCAACAAMVFATRRVQVS
jgi:ABC-2 type transport system permease protein